MRSVASALSIILAVAPLIASTPCGAAQIPASIEAVGLADGVTHKFETGGGAQLTVVVFLSARCPCSASHEPTLAALANEFGKEARFVGVHSNSDEPREESAAHFKGAALPFPVLQDEGAKIAGQFGALKTPHVYVLGKDGKVVFQGGVDNSHTASDADKFYLKDALTSLRAGKDPEINLARAIGCAIRR
jgi:peroxiredoxin